jgi:hypothetical protein
MGTLLRPSDAPPALPLIDGYPQVGVITRVTPNPRAETVTLDGVQRFALIEVESLTEAVVQLIGDEPGPPDYEATALGYETRMRHLPPESHARYPTLRTALQARSLQRAPHDIYDAVSRCSDGDDSQQVKELFGFAVASALHDLTLAERLALLLTVDGTGRIEWLLKRKLNLPLV